MARLVAVAVAFAVSAAADDRDELAMFSGTWRGVAVIEDGVERPKAEAEAARLTVAAEKYTLKLAGQDIEGTHKLDPTTSPKQIEAVRAKGPHAGEKMLGIDELTADSFKVCFAAPGRDRPTDFTSPPGSGRRVLRFKRDKP